MGPLNATSSMCSHHQQKVNPVAERHQMSVATELKPSCLVHSAAPPAGHRGWWNFDINAGRFDRKRQDSSSPERNGNIGRRKEAPTEAGIDMYPALH